MSDKIEDLVPEMQTKVRQLIELCKKQGIEIVISETTRTQTEQLIYYLKGRCPVSVQNEIRKAYKIYTISEGENQIVTNAIVSKNHVAGEAVDLYPENIDGSADYKASLITWEKIGLIGKGLGLTWGGRWPGLKDYPHFQLRPEK